MVRNTILIKYAKIEGKTKIKTLYPHFSHKMWQDQNETLHQNFLNNTNAYYLQILKNSGAWYHWGAKKQRVTVTVNSSLYSQSQIRPQPNYPQKRSQPGKQKYPYPMSEVDSPYILVFQHDDTISRQNCEENEGNFYLPVLISILCTSEQKFHILRIFAHSICPWDRFC